MLKRLLGVLAVGTVGSTWLLLSTPLVGHARAEAALTGSALASMTPSPLQALEGSPEEGWWSGTITVTTDASYLWGSDEGPNTHGVATGTLILAVDAPGNELGEMWSNDGPNATLISQAYSETRVSTDPLCAGTETLTLGPAGGGPTSIAVVVGVAGVGYFSAGAQGDDLTAVNVTTSGCGLGWGSPEWTYAFGWCGLHGDQNQSFEGLPTDLTEIVVEDVNGVPTRIRVNRTAIRYSCGDFSDDTAAVRDAGSSTVVFDLRFGPSPGINGIPDSADVDATAAAVPDTTAGGSESPGSDDCSGFFKCLPWKEIATVVVVVAVVVAAVVVLPGLVAGGAAAGGVAAAAEGAALVTAEGAATGAAAAATTEGAGIATAAAAETAANTQYLEHAIDHVVTHTAEGLVEPHGDHPPGGGDEGGAR